MKHLLLLFLVSCSFQSNAQTWHWTKQLKDSFTNKYNDNYGNGAFVGGNSFFTKTDKLDNIFMLSGVRIAKWDFWTGADLYTDLMRICKVDKNGTQLWVKYFTQIASGNNGSFRTVIYDMQVDSNGNTYALMRNFKKYDSVLLNNNTTTNCLVKIDANGKLVWKKPIGAIENSFAAPGFLKMVINNRGTSLYVYTGKSSASLQFLDSNFVAGQAGMRLIRIDSSGSVKECMSILNASPPGGDAQLAINDKDEIFISGTGGQDINFPDTTIAFATYNKKSKCFYGLFSGNNFSRKWLRITTFLTDNAVLSVEPLEAKFTSNGNIGMLWNISRSDADISKPMVYGDTTVDIRLKFSGENAFMFIVDSTGKLLNQTNIDSTYRSSVRDSRMYIDKSDNLYAMSYRYGSGSRVFLRTKSDLSNVYAYPAKNLSQVLAFTSTAMVMTTFFSYSERVFGPDQMQVPSGCSVCRYIGISSIDTSVNVIRGKVFRDLNGNGVQDANEMPVSNLNVVANNGVLRSFTDKDGNYMIITGPGTFNITIPQTPLFYTPQPANHTVTFGGSGVTILNKDFALAVATIANDLSVGVQPIGRVRPGFPATVMITASNKGTTTLSGNYTLKLPTGISFVSSDSTYVIVAADSIRWNFTNFAPGGVIKNFIRLQASVSLINGTPKTYRTTIFPIIADTFPNNNIDTARIIVSASFDPNDKLVLPTGPILIDSVTTGTATLRYTIRFQNTGTDTAFIIRVADKLSELLDASTIQLVGSSHPVEVEWFDGNVVNFFYRNILLPDSNVNEPRSHGFVTFTISPKTNLTLSDTIYNSAAIYFDYNDPVVTNTVTSSFRNNSILPVTITSFVVAAKGSAVLLRWRSEMEDQLAWYEVEWSKNGISFSTKLKLAAVGVQANTYETLDLYPVNGINYYRLKLIDKDGKISYSGIRTVSFVSSLTLQINPNPVSSKLRYIVTSDKGFDGTLSIYDIYGKRLKSLHVSGLIGYYEGELDISNLPTGMYMIEVRNANGTHTLQKLMKN